jgi:hypothetical protein
MSDTTRLGLPYLAAAQSQKHVTHNEALQMLDALVQISVQERPRNAAPGAPADGERYLVGPAPTGDFAGQAGALAAFDDGAWRFMAARAGWIAHVRADGRLLVHDGTLWRDFEGVLRRLVYLDGIGIAGAPDAGNAFVARLAGALFAARPVAEGGTGSVRVTLNRDLPAGTASHVWQTGFSGRAEAGLAGDDRWRLRVSADGATWRDAIVVDPATGALSLPGGIADAGPAALPAMRNHVVNGDFAVAQRGPGPFALAAGSVFGFDRWRLSSTSAATATLTRAPLAPGQTTGPVGRFFASFAVTATGAGAAPVLATRLEQVARLAGQAVVLSFWYRATTSDFALDMVQDFGAGASPAVAGLAAASLPAAGAWTFRSVRLVLPPVTGKTIAAGGGVLAIRFTLAGAAPATLDLADVQLEEGVFATAFERRALALELLLARRFFRRSTVALAPADLAAEMAGTPVSSGAGPFDYAAEI